MKARQFAEREIRPLSLARDRINDAAGTWDWDIIRKGSALGFRLKAEPVHNSEGDAWILNGENCFIANGGVGKLFFVSARTNFRVPVMEGSNEFMVPIDTSDFRIGKKYNKAIRRLPATRRYANPPTPDW